MKKTITFQRPSQLPTYSRAIVWSFPFLAVDSALLGAPEEENKTLPHQIRVFATFELILSWNFYFVISSEINDRVTQERHDLMKILYEYAKRHIAQKLKNAGSLSTEENLELNTTNTETRRPFNPSRIPDPEGDRFEVSDDQSASSTSTINITAQRDVNIGGDVIGRDKSTNQQSI